MKESSEEEKKSEINKNYLIIGPRISFTEYEDLNKHFNIHGDGKKTVEIGEISIEEGSRVVINAHAANSGGRNQIRLGPRKLRFKSEFDFTSYIFQCLKTRCNVELFSCYGGNAICNIVDLPKDSTLITFVDEKHMMLSNIAERLITTSINFRHPENPFTRFASFLATNADNTRFSINIDTKYKSFRSDVDRLKNFSNEGIRAWQKKQISIFIRFINEIKNDSNETNREKIDQLTELVKDEEHLNQFVNEFDVNLYRRMLVMNFITQGKTQSIESCLDHIELTNEDYTLINIVAHSGNKEILELFLAKRFDANGIYRLAIQEENIEMVRLLLENGANIDQTDELGNTPLFITAYKGNIGMVNLLLEKGAKIDQATKLGHNPLLIAANKEDTEMVKLLLEYGADINHQDNEGFTALHLAALKGRTEMVKLLLEYGADINRQDNSGKTPLLFAVDKKNIEMLNLLLANQKLMGTHIGDLTNKIIENIDFKILPEIEQLPQKLKERLVKDLNLYIKENIEQSKGYSIKKIISAFPEEDRPKYFTLSAKEAMIECASQDKNRDVRLILEAFPNQEDRARILNETILITSDIKAVLLLIKFRFQENTLNLTSPSKEEAKIEKMERKNKASKGL